MKRSFAFILAMTSACLLLAFVVAGCGAEQPDPESSIFGQKAFRDARYGVFFLYPSNYEVVDKQGHPSKSSSYQVAIGAGPSADGTAHQSFGMLTIGGWGEGRPDLIALSPLDRLRRMRNLIRRNPQAYVVGNGRLVEVLECSVVNDKDGPALLWDFTTKEKGQLQTYYTYNTFRDDLGCMITVRGDPADKAALAASVLMAATFNYSPPK